MTVQPMEGELARAPRLQCLLTPEETLLYTVRFHPLRGWWLLLAGLACLGAAWVWPVAFVGAVALVGLWYLPLYTNEVAVTDDRLLLRTGWLSLRLEAIEDHSIFRWEMTQSAVGSMLDYGSVKILIREPQMASTRAIDLGWVWHPVTLLEALQRMQEERYKDNAAQ